MKQEELEKRIITVMEFDGWIHGNTPSQSWIYDGDKGYYVETNVINTKYHTSYDWLMPVWVKFRDAPLDGVSSIDQNTHSEKRHMLRQIITGQSIADAFEALFDAIIWYQSLKTQSHD